ncbi:hypothetical protein [Mycetocola lacteus]|uniref:hypothetical protein n=1 Tax=Mycetocola lacteus TaxID=76637 RepID=UPI0011C3B750|nr:hypothetical protein [Mycetocola lacteus]
MKSLGGSVILVAALSLTGCVPTSNPYPEIPRFAKSGGQTQAELNAKLATIPGLKFQKSSGGKPNVKGNTGFTFHFELDSGYRIADPAGLVDYLSRSAWSVRDGYMPNSAIYIECLCNVADNLDLVVAGEDAGWVPKDSQLHRGPAENGYTDVNVWVSADNTSSERRGAVANRERLGTWPGDAPAVPENLVVPR